jgi:hypothetical protein
MIDVVFDDPPEMSLLELLGSIIDRRSLFLYVKLATSDWEKKKR